VTVDEVESASLSPTPLGSPDVAVIRIYVSYDGSVGTEQRPFTITWVWSPSLGRFVTYQ